MNNVSAEYRSSFKCLYSGLFISLYSGKPIFPIVLGGLTVHSLGEVSHMKHLCTFYVRDWDWAAPLGLYSLMNPFLWGKFSLCVSKIHDTGLVMDRPPWDVRNKRIIRKDTFKAMRDSPVDRVACWIDHNEVASSIELLEWNAQILGILVGKKILLSMDLRMERFAFIKVVTVLPKETKVGSG